MNAEKIFGENVYVNLDEAIETIYKCRGDEANDEWVERWLKPLKSLPTIEVTSEHEPTWEQVKEYCFRRNFAIVGREIPKEYTRGYAEVCEDAISREYLEKRYWRALIPKGMVNTDVDLGINIGIEKMHDIIKHAPRAVPQVPSEDCISRKWLFDKAECGFDKLAEYYDINHMLRDIKDAPSVMPKRSCYRCGLREDCEDSTERKPKQGEWIPNHDGTWNCSNCGLRVLIYAKGNYCPNCGAKMKGAEE